MSKSDCFLSGCLIVKNETQNLARCLESIVPYLDELVVVDTGSTDDTVAIAQQFDAIIHHFQWCDDFSAARNFAISKVCGEWILMLDADEELIVQDQAWMRQLKNNNHVAFAIELHASDDDATVFPANRVFRNHPQLKYEGKYHEYLTWQLKTVVGITPLQGVKLIHYGYESHLLPQKGHARIPMLERLRQNEGLSLLLLWSLMGMYIHTGQEDKAQNCCEEASERLFPALMTGEKPQDFRSVVSWLHTLGENCLKTEDYEGLRLICIRGLSWCPTFPPLIYLTGLLLRALELDRGAFPYFKQCLELNTSGQFSQDEPFDQQILTVLPHYQLGCLYQQFGELQSAAEHFVMSLEFNPQFSPSQIKLDALSL